MNKSLAIAALLGLALSAQAADLPVKPAVSAKKAAAAPGGILEERIVRQPVVGSQYWLSGMLGVLATDDGEMWSQGFGGYLQDGRLLGGVRARFNRGFGYVRHGRELGAMVGQPFGERSWYAVGLGRYEYDRRDPNNPERREVIGVPVEVVYAPSDKRFGLELRAEANINTAHPQVLVGLGARFGRLR